MIDSSVSISYSFFSFQQKRHATFLSKYCNLWIKKTAQKTRKPDCCEMQSRVKLLQFCLKIKFLLLCFLHFNIFVRATPHKPLFFINRQRCQGDVTVDIQRRTRIMTGIADIIPGMFSINFLHSSAKSCAGSSLPWSHILSAASSIRVGTWSLSTSVYYVSSPPKP